MSNLDMYEHKPKISVFIPVLDIHKSIVPMTQKCIDMARKNTFIPFELIIVENGTTHFKDQADIFIYKKEFQRYSINCNLAMGAAHSSDYVIGIGNDAFMPNEWLEALLECFYREPLCGVATLNSSEFNSPCSRHIVEDIGGSVFCMKRQMINKVGYWDENYINSFEDSDYWVRVLLAGYTINKNMRVMVEHLSGRTWVHMNDHHDNFIKNREYYNKKWEGCGVPLFEKLR